MSNEIPRRIQMDNMAPAELRILEATRLIEEMGADERLTEAQMLLAKARSLVADVVDGREKLEAPAGPDEVWLLTHDDGRQYEGTRVYLTEASANFQAARMSLKVVRYAKVKP